jgi:threonine-phosphate decarboxylase
LIEPCRSMFVGVPAHGGQLKALAAEFGIDASELLDFSASIHPVPPPSHVLAALSAYIANPAHLTAYPDSNYSDLKEAIAAYANVNASSIVIGNGVMPLLQATLRAVEAKRCLILVPAFTEYVRTLAANKVECCSFYLPEAQNFSLDAEVICETLQRTASDVLLLANPHSPSGMLSPARELHALAAKIMRLGATMIVDEAFIDYTPDESVAQLAEQIPGLIVLRSLTKFFAIPGLRVAYAIGQETVKAGIEACVPLWPVGALESEAARLMVKEMAWIESARESNTRERTWLTAQLSSLGLQVYPAFANYLLIRVSLGRGIALWQELITRHRIVIRPCLNFEGLDAGLVRVAVRSRHENERLVNACAQVISTLFRG